MRPSVSLACILKNEVNNIAQLLSSVKDCFDEIHLTDTGSTDGSIKLIQSYIDAPNPANSKIFLHHFEWCDDFAKARDASFSHPKTDYIMWLDLDDVLGNRVAFIDWRDSVMKLSDFWIATYHYASNAEGRPLCSFARERVVRRDLDLKWKYFVHEGMIPISAKKKDVRIDYASTWNVIHKRKEDDVKKDSSRNLLIFEKNKGNLCARMKYYYGKELFENRKPLEAFPELIAASALPELEPHDRIMCIQYAILSVMQLGQFERAIQLAHQGLQLAPLRAEFAVAIADSYVKLGRLLEAIPYYSLAAKCPYTGDNKIQGAMFMHEDSYKHYPLNQIARIYANIGDMDKAKEYIDKAILLGPNLESMGIIKEITEIKEKAGLTILVPKTKNEDIVISGHPVGFYEWDEAIYRERGIGGSETAVVEMARHLADMTGRKVKIFNNRTTAKEFGNVSYLPAHELPLYFGKNTPHRHIAWRHNTKLTDAPTYVWCHDLGIPGIDNVVNYDRVFCLSEFHKNYVSNMFGVPKDKIWVTGNGIDPSRFHGLNVQKNYGKVVFSSSPDRGLDRVIRIMDQVVLKNPEAHLHAYYGFDNMRKNNRGQEADELQAMIKSRPYITFYGNLEQKHLTKEISSACVWLYPTNFLETYCITAVEMLCSSVYPVVRDWGALKDTLKGQPADILDTEDEDIYAIEVLNALQSRPWEQMKVNPDDYSWEKVAKTWVEFLGL